MKPDLNCVLLRVCCGPREEFTKFRCRTQFIEAEDDNVEAIHEKEKKSAKTQIIEITATQRQKKCINCGTKEAHTIRE